MDPDPDTHVSALISGGWIRIQEGKNYAQKPIKVKPYFEVCWVFSFEG
jgi:hypothetical protein